MTNEIWLIRCNIFKFVLVEPVNCQWNAWTEGPCSHSCNGGERKKKRTKKVKEKFGGACEGSSSIVEECNLNRCPGSLESLFNIKNSI